MKKVIFDTNMLLAIHQYKIDIFSEVERIADFNYKLCILDKTVDELNKIIKEQKGKDKAAANLALRFLDRFEIIKTKEGNVDDILVSLSKENVVATQDRELQKRLKSRYIVIKQGRLLALK